MWDQLQTDKILFVLIDYQEKFFPILKKKHIELVQKNLMLLIKMFKKLEVPMLGTEHYLKGLGPTEKKVLEAWEDSPAFTDKITFSCCGDDKFLKNLDKYSRPTVIVAGLETHICVLQTTLDLLEKNYNVIVLKDACLSTTTLRWQNGLDLMEKAGAHIMNTETVLFYLLQRADSPEFKHMVSLLKENK